MRRIGSTAQRLREKPYEKRVCRIENYPECILRLAFSPEDSYMWLPVEEYVDLIHETGVEVQIVAGEIDRGTPRFHSKMIPPHPNVDRDRLPRFLEMAHEKGILVLAYYSMNYCKPLKKIHPEWLMKFLDDGRPEPENLGWFCFNSPFRDWLPEYLNEFLDNLDLDGLYFDDMNWGSHEDWPYYISCCCKYCEDLFRKETGLKIPTKVDFASVDFKRFVNWRYDKMREYIAHVTRKVKEKHPDAILDYNYYGNSVWDDPGGAWTHGHPFNPLHLEDVGAHFFIETDPVREGSSFSAKIARAHGSPFAIWRHAMQTLPECCTSTAPNPELFSPMIHGLAAIANGGQSIFGMFDGPVQIRKDFMRTMFSELKRRVDYIEGETVKYIALHYSQQTRDLRPSKEISQYHKIVKGTFEMLNQSHLLVDIVFDEQLTYEKMSQYKVLFLSNSACLSDEQCEEIRRFVRGGGTVIATHETSLYDELGRKRENFLLADVLGVDYQSSIDEGAVHGVVYVPRGEGLSRDFGYVICFAAQDSDVSLRPNVKVEVLCTRSSLKGKQPLDNFDAKVNYDSGKPAVTVHKFGKGKAIYISGDVGGGFLYNPYPPLKRFVANLVSRTKPPIEVEAPKAIEVTAATRGSKELMVHLLNNPAPLMPYQGVRNGMTTHFYLEEVNPVHNIRLRFNEFKVKGATMPLQNLSLNVKGKTAEVVVPEVKLHEVVLVETG